MGAAEARRAFWLRLLAGPAAFAAVRAAPLAGLAPEGHLALGAYAWVLAWWATQPVPWAVTSFLPFVLLPLGGVMAFADVAARYGHTILPYLVGVMLFGHAFGKHGLARRIALAALCLPGTARAGGGLILAIMTVSALLSAVVSDLAVAAIMTPIALSIARSVSPGAGRLAAAASLAVLYGATAGGMATPAGAVYNPVTLGLLERLTAYSVTFAQWTSTGVILTAAHLPICYLVLTLMLRPEVQAIPDRARLRRELARLGPMSRGEKNVLFVLVVMLVLWILPTFVSIEFLDIWYAPPVAMVLLFALPVDARGQPTLEAGDVREGVGWNVLFLVLGGMALADVLASVGVTDWLAALLTGNVTAGALPWVAGLATPLLTQLANGPAASVTVATTLFPIADALGYNSPILARIIAGTADAVTLPWASGVVAVTFASGAVGLGTMFRTGAVVTVLTSIVMVLLSIFLVPALQAFEAQPAATTRSVGGPQIPDLPLTGKDCPGAGERHLADTWLRPIADAFGEGPPQGTQLLCGQDHRIVVRVDRLQGALEDVIGQRRPRHDPGVGGDREQLGAAIHVGDLRVGRRVAGIDEVRGPVGCNLPGLRHVRRVGKDVGQPLVDLRNRLGRHDPKDRIGSAVADFMGYEPDVVIGVAVGLEQPGARDQGVVAVMHVDVGRIARRTRCNAADPVGVPADVEDRQVPQTTLTGVETAGLVGDPHGVRVGASTLSGHDDAVEVMAADPSVQLHELFERDNAVLERLQTVLDAHVVPWTAGESCLGIEAVHGDQVVLIGTAHILPLLGLEGPGLRDR